MKKINWATINKIATAAVFGPYLSAREKENTDIASMIDHIIKEAKVSIEEVSAFAKSNYISLPDLLYYAARFGKLPDQDTAIKIYSLGFHAWYRFYNSNISFNIKGVSGAARHLKQSGVSVNEAATNMKTNISKLNKSLLSVADITKKKDADNG